MDVPCTLPPAQYLPQLVQFKTTLQQGESAADACSRVAPYMSQLQRIDIDSRAVAALRQVPWPTLFSATTNTTPLQRLSVCTSLTDELIGE